MRRIWLVGLLALLGMTAGAGAAALDLGGGNDSAGVVDPAPEQRPTPATEVPDAVRAAFGVFRAEATEADRLDDGLRAKAKVVGIAADLARIVVGSPSVAFRSYVAPGPDGSICFFNGLGSGGCSTGEEFIARGAIGTDECAPGLPEGAVALSGMVRDGVDEVELVRASGEPTRVEIRRNAWHWIVSGAPSERPTSVRWTYQGEPTVQRIPYSPDVDSGC